MIVAIAGLGALAWLLVTASLWLSPAQKKRCPCKDCSWYQTPGQDLCTYQLVLLSGVGIVGLWLNLARRSRQSNTPE